MPLIGRTNDTLPVEPSVTESRVVGLKVKVGRLVVKHGLVMVTEKPIVPLAGNVEEPAGPLFAIAIVFATVKG